MRGRKILVALALCNFANGQNYFGALKNVVNDLITREAAVVRNLMGPSLETTDAIGTTEEPLRTQLLTTASPSYGATAFGGFRSAIFTSVTLTVFTEFGDRTFFISGLLALKYPKLIVFTASVAALLSQTVFSTTVGHVCHVWPIGGKLQSFPLDDYAAALLLIVFGFIHLRAVCEDSRSEEAKEIEQIGPREIKAHYVELGDAERITASTALTSEADLTPPSAKRRDSLNAEFAEAARDVEKLSENIGGGAGFWRVWRRIFWIIFVAELGDKSMFSTVALAAAQNPVGVFLGCSCAHALVTGIAVVTGSVLQGYLNERTANLAGATLFFLFGALALGEGVARQTHSAATTAKAAAALIAA